MHKGASSQHALVFKTIPLVTFLWVAEEEAILRSNN